MQEEVDFCIELQKLCKKFNILFIADEIRMGSCKTGKFLSSDWMGPEHKPDLVVLGKGISGGIYPASFVLGNNDTMTLIKSCQSRSTYGCTAMAVTAVRTALSVYEEERLQERARDVHAKWVAETSTWNFPYLRYAPAFGADLNLLLDVAYENRPEHVTARRLAMVCASKGLLVAAGFNGRVRLGVALTITDEELFEGFKILKQSLEELPLYGEIEGSEEGNLSIAKIFT